MDSFLWYSTTFLATPAVSRKTCGSNEPLLPLVLCFFGFIVASKLRLGVDIPPHNHTTKKDSQRLYRSEQRTFGTLAIVLTGRRDRAILAGPGGVGRYPSSRRPTHLGPGRHASPASGARRLG